MPHGKAQTAIVPEDKSQRDRFIENARKLGVNEDEAAFKETLAVIARQRPMGEPSKDDSSDP